MKKRFFAAALISVVVFILVLIFPFSGTLELKTLDLRFRIRKPLPLDAPIVIVSIDDASFEYLNRRWPWPRTYFAQAIDYLSEFGARVIGLDVMLGDRDYDEKNDLILADSITSAGNVVLPMKFGTRQTGAFTVDYVDVPMPLYRDEMAASGYINLLLDPDGYSRRVLLTDSSMGPARYPFFLELLSAYHDEEIIIGESGELQVGPTRVPYMEGNRLIINYAGVKDPFPIVPFYQVMEGAADPSLFAGKIVLIGAYFKESHDQMFTPFNFIEGLYGVEISAEALNTVFSGAYLREPGNVVSLLILLITTLCGVWFMTGMKPQNSIPLMFAVVAVYFLNAVLIFSKAGIVLPVFDPLLAVVLACAGSLVFRYLVVDREKRAIRATFSRFVSPKIVNQILENSGGVRLGGELREVVIFFSDIELLPNSQESD